MNTHVLTVKELYDWAVEHGRENDGIAIECGGLENVDNDEYPKEFQGLACIIDDRHDTYHYYDKPGELGQVSAIWLCCADGELYIDAEERSSTDYYVDSSTWSVDESFWREDNE